MTVDTLTSAGRAGLISRTHTLRLPEQPGPAPAATATTAHMSRRSGTAPIAAVRLSDATFPGVVAGLHQAGLDVLDINAHEVGPRPQLIVLELPDDEAAARRLVRGSGHGPGRLFVTRGPDLYSLAGQTSGCDEILQVPCNPLQIAAAALRVSRAPEHLFLEWARRVFDDIRADDVLVRS
jgi:hypothetical protein